MYINDLTDNGETFKFGYDSVNDQMGYYKKVAGADTFFPFKSTLAKVKIGEDSRSYGALDIQTKTYAIPQELQGKMTADNVVVHIVSTDCRGGYLFAKAYLTSITDTTVSVQAGNFHTVAGGTVSYEVWLYYVD